MTKSRDLGNLVSDGASSGVAVYTGLSGTDGTPSGATYLLNASSPSAGDLAYVTANTSLYQNNGNGWYKIATVNTNPTIGSNDVSQTTSGSTTTLSDNGTFTLTPGANTVVTITASDEDPGTDLTYTKTVTSGTASNVATITQGTGASENVFTFAPATSVGGTITVRFDVTDNTNTAQFTQSFSITFSTPYSLKNASYDNINQVIGSVSFHGFDWKPDGTRLHILEYGGSTKNIREYSVSSAWNLGSTLTSLGTFSYASQDSWPYGMLWGDSGSKLYILGTSTTAIFQYTASTAYQTTSGLSYANKSFNFGSQGNLASNGRNFYFKPDGSKMFMTDASSLFEYSASSGNNWSINNFSYTSSVTLPSSTSSISQARSIIFNPAGTIMTIVANDYAFEFALSTAWDKSTLSFTRQFLHDDWGEWSVYGGSTAGTKLYIGRYGNKSIAQYSVG